MYLKDQIFVFLIIHDLETFILIKIYILQILSKNLI